MSEVSVKVNIAGRTYPLTVDQQDHEHILQAEKNIEESIQQFKQNYAVKDKQDLLAMAALQLTARKHTQELPSPEVSPPPGNEEDLARLESLLDSYLG